MLELDLMLERFLDECYADLDSEGQGRFERFLAHPDPVLHEWLMGFTQATDPAEQDLVDKIRTCNLTAFR